MLTVEYVRRVDGHLLLEENIEVEGGAVPHLIVRVQLRPS